MSTSLQIGFLQIFVDFDLNLVLTKIDFGGSIKCVNFSHPSRQDIEFILMGHHCHFYANNKELIHFEFNHTRTKELQRVEFISL